MNQPVEENLEEKDRRRRRVEKIVSNIGVCYFVFGLVFAVYFAYYYHWEAFGYFSPNFFLVAFSWPYQAIGFIRDILQFGFGGKPI